MLKDKIIVCVDSSFVNLTSLGLMLEMAGFRGEVKNFQTSEAAASYFI